MPQVDDFRVTSFFISSEGQAKDDDPNSINVELENSFQATITNDSKGLQHKIALKPIEGRYYHIELVSMTYFSSEEEMTDEEWETFLYSKPAQAIAYSNAKAYIATAAAPFEFRKPELPLFNSLPGMTTGQP